MEPNNLHCVSIKMEPDSGVAIEIAPIDSAAKPKFIVPEEERPRASVLPPCRVCDEKATGFHYGVNTCEACKGFFRRTLAKNRFDDYLCETKSCSISYKNRANCAYCRIQKCLAVGMSKNGIRRGRYTLEKKANFIKEVKRLQKLKKIEKLEEHLKALEERKPEIEQLINHVTQMNRTHTNFTQEFIDKIPKYQDAYLKKKNIDEKVFGRLPKLEPSKYKELYDMTGLDVDDRKKEMQLHLPALEKGLKNHVNFCKSLPGFNTLCQEDQVILVKTSMHMCQTLTLPVAINIQDQLFTNVSGRTITKEDFGQVACTDISDELFRVAVCVQKASLKEEELALLKAISVFLTDDIPQPLTQRGLVDTIQEEYVESLQYFIDNTYSRERRGRLGCVLYLLTEVRRMVYLHEKYREEMFDKVKGLQVPPLLLEFLTS